MRFMRHLRILSHYNLVQTTRTYIQTFSSLKTYLRRREINCSDDSKRHVCDSCERAKATKVHNCKPQKKGQQPHQFIRYTDLVGPINPIGFTGERYFITYTDDATQFTDTFTGTKKSDWQKCLKTLPTSAASQAMRPRAAPRGTTQ